MLCESMKKAGEEERQLAVQRGDFHQDVPAISVIVDGRWSKRSHKHFLQCKIGSWDHHWNGNEEAASHWSTE